MDAKWFSDFESATGFPHFIVEALASVIEAPIHTVAAALIMIHSNTSNVVLRMLVARFYPAAKEIKSVSSLMKAVNEVLQKNSQKNLSRPENRFQKMHPLFSTATCCLDGVPIFMRGTKKYYNGKHKDKFITNQVWVCWERRPMWYMGPYPGKMHDAACLNEEVSEEVPEEKSSSDDDDDGADDDGADDASDSDDEQLAAPAAPFEQKEPFVHFREEGFHTDLGYISNNHCVCPVKKGNDTDALVELTEPELVYNEHHKKLRARVESFFAYLDRHRFLHYCLRRPNTIALMWHLMWNAECLLDLQRPAVYRDVFTAPTPAERGFVTECKCEFKGTSARVTEEYKRWLVSHVCRVTEMKYPICRNPQHRAKSAPSHKDPAKQAAKRKEKSDQKIVVRTKALVTRTAVKESKARKRGENSAIDSQTPHSQAAKARAKSAGK